jgi:hypothetical protein
MDPKNKDEATIQANEEKILELVNTYKGVKAEH